MIKKMLDGSYRIHVVMKVFYIYSDLKKRLIQELDFKKLWGVSFAREKVLLRSRKLNAKFEGVIAIM